MEDSKIENKDHTIENKLDIEKLLAQLTLEEKFKLLVGHTFFTTYPIPRLNIPEFGMTDGPHGAGAHSANNTKNTYFPASVGMAASWNPLLCEEFGKALAQETRAVGRHSILAPGFNICRTPLNGRTFEYLSEDPYLNKKLVVPIIKGIQSQRISACVKHFICNNQEYRRKFSNSIVDERTLEEIYYPAFKTAIKEANPWMLMTSYNLLNGKYLNENITLMANKVCQEWGFNGFVVSDWTATHYLRDPAKALKAKLSLEMPSAFVYKIENLKKAYEAKEFTDEDLNDCIRRLLGTMFRVGIFESEEYLPKGSRNTPEHLEIARKMAEESFVLLKNENKILPINENHVSTVCLTGDMKNYHFAPISWGGSSAVSPPHYTSVKEALFHNYQNKIKITTNPAKADIAIIVTGISHIFFNDSEGQDKRKLSLAARKIKQIKRVAKKNPNTIVILFAGGPINMEDWIDDVAGVIMVWQPHQEAGNAIVNTIFGKNNPSGKLPMTFPKHLIDSPVHSQEFPLGRAYPAKKYRLFDMINHELLLYRNSYKKQPKIIDIHYDEGIYVGYRHFDAKQIEPLFPFGYGLSYTEFTYENLSLDKAILTESENLTVSFEIENIGNFEGKEVAQLYIQDEECSVDRPPKELKGFVKIALKPGEKQTIRMTLTSEDLAFYDIETHRWKIEPGYFKVLIGSSSRNIRFEHRFEYK